MSTRALYIFSNNFDDFSCEQYAVYKHHDGYPSVAREHIRKAQSLTWTFPRFEADEFAAAFVAANKDTEGGIRLQPNGKVTGKIISEYFDVAFVYWIDFPPRTARSKRFRKYPRVRYQQLPYRKMSNLQIHWKNYAKDQID